MNEKRWTKLASIAEIVSSVAILITLIFLAIQTSQNTGAINSASHQQLLNSDLELLRELRDNPEIGQTFRKAEVTQEERTRLRQYLISFLRVREFAYFQYREGRMDEDTWYSYAAATTGLFRADLAKEIFDESASSDSYHPDFIEVMREFVYRAE